MRPSPPSHPAFLRALGLGLAAGALAVLALVLVVDPYHLYRLVDRPGFNQRKPGLTRYQEPIKVSNALALRPAAVVLGNSRAEIGFDPATLAALGAGPAYNLAIPGSGLQSSRSEFAQLRAAGIKPRTVIVGVEFFDFLTRSAEREDAAPAPAPPGALERLGWRFDTLFSLASVKDAVRTLFMQRDEDAASTRADGFNPLNEYRAAARREGYRALFEQAAAAPARRLAGFAPVALDHGDLAHLHAIAEAALSDGAELKLVIYPYHAAMLAMIERHGAWPAFERWKALLADERARLQAAHPGARVSLVDFSGFGPYNCEAVPAAGDLAHATAWYWEAGHFKKELGDIMLKRLLGPPSPVAGFGVELGPDTLAANAARIAAERRACAAVQPAPAAPAPGAAA